jgi:adenylate kinase family enzyme
MFDRAIVIGCPGAGKSTFARKLRDRTGLPLYYLDRLFHRPDRSTLSREAFDRALGELLVREKWILDGNYMRTLPLRLRSCERAFFFDLPVEACLEGAEARIGTAREDLPWVETGFDPEFRQYILDFPNDQLPEIRRLLASCARGKVIVFRSREEADDWLEHI